MARDAFDLVIVGSRPGPLQAASRLGARVLLVEEREPGQAARRRAAACVMTPLEGADEALLAVVRDALGASIPQAVVASGERGVLGAAAVRDAYGLPGADRETAHRARDKHAMKTAARAAGLPCTDWLPLDADSRADDLIDALGLPLVLKRRTGSGSRDLCVLATLAQARQALARLPAQERAGWLAERYLDGVEMSVESFVADGEILLVNPTEYLVPAFANVAPAHLPPAEWQTIQRLNAAALQALGLRRGMTHLELYRTAEGPVFGEVAVRPPGGRIMRLLRRAYAFDPWEAVLRLARGERPVLPRGAIQSAGVWMLHPGRGRALHVRGLAAARRVPGVRKLVCRLRAGQVVDPRPSTGVDVGWIEVWGRDRDEVVARLGAAHACIDIRMQTQGALPSALHQPPVPAFGPRGPSGVRLPSREPGAGLSN